jgi:DNA repair exonuclease SbcCD ATPase subunit
MEHQELSEAKTKIEKLQSELRSKNYFAAVASQRQAELEALKVRHQGETQFYTKKIEDLQNKISIYRKRVRDLKEIAENKSTKYREELRYAHSPRWWLTYPVDFITKHLRK